jgi:hypothetical protein
MPRMIAVATFLALAVACTPQNASITDGSYTAFLATSTSPTISKDVLHLSHDGVDPSGFDSRLQLDCRDANDVGILPNADLTKCPAVEDLEYETWMGYDGYEVLTSAITDDNQWRGEAVITSEGDLQITFHIHLPNAQDFRFAVVVDPQFQPTECAQDENGVGVRQNIDGDWLAEWSKDAADMGGGTMFYLNSGGSQINPSNADVTWILPDKWLAGVAIGKFAEETFNSRPPVYEYVGVGPDDPDYDTAYDTLIADTKKAAADTINEYSTVAGVEVSPMVHDNRWRVPDDNQAGLDSWVELHHNWIRFDQPASELAEVGNPASGDFYLNLQTSESVSVITVKGSFDISKIKADHWTVPDLNEQKLLESNSHLCGDEAPAE